MAAFETIARAGDEPLLPAVLGADVPEANEAPAPWVAPDHSVKNRGLRAVIGLASLAVGVGLATVGTAVLTDANGVLRIGLVLAGLFAVYVALDSFGKLLFGCRFETGLWLSIAWLAVVVLSAVLADVLPLAESSDVSQTLTSPTLLRPDLFSGHPLGTDRQGLDILGGVVYGARVSLVVSLGAVMIGMSIGGVIGICAGYFRGKVESITGFLTDSMLAFPPLIFLLGLVAVLEPSVRNVTIALAVLGIPTYIRLARANTMVFAQREFVLAARGLGAKNRRIIFRQLLPNVALPIVSYGFIVVANLIVVEASLSFLGLSIRRPNPTWGNMIAAGQTQFQTEPHLVFAPGVVLFLTVLCINRVGDKVRSLWDPRQSRL